MNAILFAAYAQISCRYNM